MNRHIQLYANIIGVSVSEPPYKSVGRPNLCSGQGLFLWVCLHRNHPNYVCPIFRHALNAHGCMYSYCDDLCCNTPADN